MSCRAACARAATVCASPHSSSMSPPAASFGRNSTTASTVGPNYGQGLGVLGVSYSFGVNMGWADVATVLPAADRAALAAIQADSEDPWAHLALGGVCLHMGRFDDALAECELALRLNPNFSLALGNYGLVLAHCDRWEEGADAARRASRLSPCDPFSAIYSGVVAYAA